MNAPNAIFWLDMMVLRPTLIIILAFICLHICRQWSASHKHWLALCGLLSLPLLPAFHQVLPSIPVELLPQSWQPPQGGSQSPSSTPLPESMAFIALYLAGLIYCLFRFSMDILALYTVKRHSYSCSNQAFSSLLNKLAGQTGINRAVALQWSEDEIPPLTFGVIKPVIILPKSMQQKNMQEIEHILLHELGHIRRMDWPIMVAGKLTCCLLWYLPWATWLFKQMESLSENACDDIATNHGKERSAYAHHLIRIVKDRTILLTPTAFKQRAGLYQRIDDLLDDTISHRAITPSSKVSSAVTTVMLLGLLASLQLAVAPTPTDRTPYQWLTFSSGLTEAPPANNTEFPESVQLLAAQPQPRLLQSTEAKDYEPALQERIEDKIDTHFQLTKPALIEPYKVTHKATPKYPKRALSNGIEGDVIVEYDISPQGEVINPRVSHSQPSGVFERAALSALQISRFEPQKVDGEAVPTENVQTRFVFELTDSSDNNH